MKSASNISKYLTVENLALLAVCVTTLFSKSTVMTDQYVVPRQLFSLLVASIAVVAISVKALLGKRFDVDPKAWSLTVATVCTVEAAYALLQFVILKLFGIDFRVMGSFENPAGLMSALCLGLPFALYVISVSRKHKKLVFTATVLIIAAILVSESRTGILAAAIVLICYAMRFTRLSPLKCAAIVVLVVAALIAASYFINSSSADGRLLIWRASWPLIAAAPFFGYGAGAFSRMYMSAQADYLKAFPPDSEYAMLADNSIVPFNEYIDFYLNFGLFGMMLLLGFIVFLIASYCRRPDASKRFAWLSLATLAFISLFSYPFTYPFSYVILVISAIIIVKDSYNFTLSRLTKSFASVAFLLSGVYVTHWAYDRIEAERQWYKAVIKGDMVLYSYLKPRMEQIPHFLYSYAFEAFRQGDYDLSLSLAEESSKRLSHYDLELLLGDIYLKKKDYAESERHYQKAADMIPCRFVPLMAIYELYVEAGEKEKSLELAQKIIDKPIKVPSRTVSLIKLKLKKDLNAEE